MMRGMIGIYQVSKMRRGVCSPSARPRRRRLGAGACRTQRDIQFAGFAPAQLDVLPGETVDWTNVSERTHTVTADTACSTPATCERREFARQLRPAGAYAYHCTIHPGWSASSTSAA